MLAVGKLGAKDRYMPVKLRPKMSSFGGRRSFGVVVFVIDSFVGSMS